MRKIEKVNLEFVPNQSDVKISILYEDGLKSNKTTNADALLALFGGNFSTDFLPCSHDGVVFLERRNAHWIAVVQRSKKEDVTLQWDGYTVSPHKASTPPTFGIFLLEGQSSGFKIKMERILISNGPCLGSETSLQNPRWIGNIYNIPILCSDLTNVCWGDSVQRDYRVNNLSSLLFRVNAFYNETFTEDLGGGPTDWQSYTAGKMKFSTETNLNQVITTFWNAVREE